jgi:aminopeptidase N
MAPYLALVAAGHYLRVDDVSPNGIPLVYYYFPEFEEEYLEATAITPEAIDWMSELFGPYPFESYGQATYYAMGVSMETQTMTLLSYQMLNERTVIHEIAHAWFGNWVSPESWADVWRNEGLSSYAELLWLDRQEPGRLEQEISIIAAEVAERAQIYPLDEPPPERLFAFEAYNRSLLLIHALREEIGDEAFFSGLRLYIERYGGSTANHDEFQAVMEETSGRSLDDFFAPWLE